MIGVSHVFWSTELKYYCSAYVYHLNRNIFDVFSAQNAVQECGPSRAWGIVRGAGRDGGGDSGRHDSGSGWGGWGAPASPRGAAFLGPRTVGAHDVSMATTRHDPPGRYKRGVRTRSPQTPQPASSRRTVRR